MIALRSLAASVTRPFARSLSLRLLGIFLLTGAATLLLLSLLFSRGLGSQWQRNIQPHLALYARYLQQDLGSPPDSARARQLADALPIEITLVERGQSSLRHRRAPVRGTTRGVSPDARIARARPLVIAAGAYRR